MTAFGISSDLVDEGRTHPFTEMVVKLVHKRQRELEIALAKEALHATEGKLRVMAGQVSELGWVLRLIADAKGTDE